MRGLLNQFKLPSLKSAMSMSTPAPSPATVPSRQSKRKRSQVSYLVPDEDDIPEQSDAPKGVKDENGDDDEEFIVGKKASKKAKSPRRAKKIKLEEPKDTKPFPFLSLPAELRDMIYEFALGNTGTRLVTKRKSYCRSVSRVPDSSVHHIPGTYFTRPTRDATYWDSRTRRKKNKDATPTLVPSLLAVNKQIREEALGLLYGRKIVVEDTYTLFTFLANIGRENRQRLTNITIRAIGEGRGAHKSMNYAAMAFMQDCTNLKSLVFDCHNHHRETAEHVASWVWREAHLFLEAYGHAHKKKDAALDILHIHPANFQTKKNPSRWQSYNYYNPDKEDEVEHHLEPEIKKKFEASLRKLLGC